MTSIYRTIRSLPNDHHNPAVVGGIKVSTDSTIDLDANTATLAHEFVCLFQSGPTSARPKEGDVDVLRMKAGQLFLDTTLNKIITWTGVNWRDPLTGGVV